MKLSAYHICQTKKTVKNDEKLIAKMQKICQKMNEKIKEKIK